MAQPVPTSLAVGPDGALYVGELGGVGGPGTGNDVGDVNVYRIVPGQAPTVYASGLTMIGSIAFDQAATAGHGDRHGRHPRPGDQGSGLPAPGAIIRINADGSQTTLASAGLEFPLGITVAKDGSVYASNFGVIPRLSAPLRVSAARWSESPTGPGRPTGGQPGWLPPGSAQMVVCSPTGPSASMDRRGAPTSTKPVVGAASNPVGPGLLAGGSRRRGLQLWDVGLLRLDGWDAPQRSPS